MLSIEKIHDRLMDESSAAAEAMLTLYRRSVFTAENLEPLFRMCDASIRTGAARCSAIMQLAAMVSSVPFVWKIKMRDGLSSAFHATRAIANILDPKFRGVELHDSTICWCKRNMICSCFGFALPLCKESPKMIVQVLTQYDWKAVIESKEGLQQLIPSAERPTRLQNKVPNANIFSDLHEVAAKALQIDKDNQSGRKLLEILGSCDSLFRGVLQLLISRDFSSSLADGDPENLLDICAMFLIRYLHCLVPLSIDRKLNKLVGKARSDVLEIWKRANRTTDLSADDSTRPVMMLLYLLEDDQWEHQKRASPEERWESFVSIILSITDAQLDAKQTKRSLKSDHIRVELS